MSESLTAFDVIVLLIVGATFVYALVKGLTAMLLTVAAWGGAVLITLYGLPAVSGFARGMIEPASLADFIALPVLFILSLVILKLIANVAGRTVRASPVGTLDRSLGAFLGLALGAVLVSSGYLFLASILSEKSHPDWVREARLKPLVSYGASVVAQTGPELFRRASEAPESEELIERMRDNYTEAGDKARTLSETAYEDLQRRLMDRKIRELMENSTQNEADKNGNRSDS